MPRFDYMVPADEGNPQWANPDQTMIDLNVFFPHLRETVRYTSAKSDPGWEHSEEIFVRAASGEFGPIAPYIAPPDAPQFDPVAQLLDTVRELQERLRALEAGD